MTPYPKFYLTGNIELQAVVDNYQSWRIKIAFKWLGFSCFFFLILLFGITFEQPVLTSLSFAEVIACATILNFLLTDNVQSI